MSLILSQDEVESLTDRPQPKRQIEWLSLHGWQFEVGASGRPKVAQRESIRMWVIPEYMY